MILSFFYTKKVRFVKLLGILWACEKGGTRNGCMRVGMTFL